MKGGCMKELFNRQALVLVPHMVPMRLCCSECILVSSCNIPAFCVVLQEWQRQCYLSTCLRSGASWCPSAGPSSLLIAPLWLTCNCTSCPCASVSSQPPGQLHPPPEHQLTQPDMLSQGCKLLPSARADWMQPWHIPGRPSGCCPAWRTTLSTHPPGFLLLHNR